jgi:hypothetical protein
VLGENHVDRDQEEQDAARHPESVEADVEALKRPTRRKPRRRRAGRPPRTRP